MFAFLKRNPDFIIGEKSNPYMYRWFLIPRNKLFNMYLHRFLRDDEDRALHDHPWWFISLVLSGAYTEITPNGEWIIEPGDLKESSRIRCPKCKNDQPLYLQICSNCRNPRFLYSSRHRFSLAFRKAEHRHRVILFRDHENRPLSCWTLVITGRRSRDWGFWCPKGFVHWKEFTTPGDSGTIGKGCD